MGRAYAHYEDWEDWKAGLYRAVPSQLFDELRDRAADLLADPTGLEYRMRAVVDDWPTATRVVFTNPSRNHRAWLGQAACCHHSTAPEYVTRAAWRTLDPIQQGRANSVADAVIADWRAAQVLYAQ